MESAPPRMNPSFRFRPDVLGDLYVRNPQLSEQDFCRKFLNSGVGMALTRIDGAFVDCNVQFEKMLGYSREELLSTNLYALTHPDSFPMMTTCVRILLRASKESRYGCVCKKVKRL